jgi:glycosyltransferase involved in cell wall biosynthesis
MKPTLLIIVNDLKFFLSHRLNIALTAKKSGYKVYIGYGASDRISMLSLKKINLEFFYVPIKRGGFNPWNEIKSLYYIWRLIKKIKPSVVHLITLKPCLYGGIINYFSKVKGVLFAFPGMGILFSSNKWFYKIIRIFLYLFFWCIFKKKDYLVLFQNTSDRDIFIKFRLCEKNKTRLVKGCGVDLTAFKKYKEPKGAVHVMFISRLLYDKGISFFVSAAKLIKARCALPIKFWVVGSQDSGNPNSVSKTELDKWRQEGIVEIKGYINNMKNIYKKSHIVCLPSFYGEGLPNVIVEAAATGRPVVTTDHPGCRDAIIDGITGILVPIKNSEKLANAIEYLATKKKIRTLMGNKARIFAEKEFSLKKVSEKHVELYNQLLNFH